MDAAGLRVGEIDFLLESLRYTARRFEETQYPTHAMKQAQREIVDEISAKLRAIRKTLKAAEA